MIHYRLAARPLQPSCAFLRGVVGLLLIAASMSASATLVTSRAALGGDDFIDWGQLGSSLDSPSQPATVTSNLNRSASASNGGGGVLMRFDEGDGTYVGNFSAGDRLLSTAFDNGPISITFVDHLARIGTQIQVMVSTDNQDFTGVISVFGALDALLETHDLSGVSTKNGDGSAIFLGIVRTTADIDRVAFSVKFSDPAITDESLAINQLDFGGVPGNVPEPATLILTLMSLGLLGAMRRRRRQGP